MDASEDKIDAIEEEEENTEDVEEEVEEEVEVEEGGEGDGEGGEPTEMKGLDNLDSAHEEIKHSDPVSRPSSSSGKLFVGGVSWETTDEKFAKYFKKYGEIADSVIMVDKHTQAPRGFGFVTFVDPLVIDKVLADEHVIDGRAVEVKRTVPREEGPSSKGGRVKTRKIFVGGLPPSLTDDELKEHFATYGKVAEHQIMVDHITGRSRGFGFVTFEDEVTVERIVSEGKMHELGGKEVEIKKAEPKKNMGDAGFNGRAYFGGSSRGNVHGLFGSGAYGYGGGRVGGYGYGYGYSGIPGYEYGFGPMYGASGYGVGAYGYASGGRGSGGRYHPYGR